MTSTANSQYLSYIRAAIQTNQRPTAFLFADFYFGFRDLWSYEPDRTPHYTEWDFLLVSAAKLVEDYTDSETGQLMAYEYSDRVDWDLEKRIKKSKAAIENRTSGKNYKAAPGESWIARPRAIDGEALPTIREWIESEAAKKSSAGDSQNGKPMSKFTRKGKKGDGPKMQLPDLPG